MKISVTSIVASALFFAAGASAEAVEMSPDNFNAEVFDSGKNAFVKFLAPW